MLGATATLRRASLPDAQDCGLPVDECMFGGCEIYPGDTVYQVEAGVVCSACKSAYCRMFGIDEDDLVPETAGEGAERWQ